MEAARGEWNSLQTQDGEIVEQETVSFMDMAPTEAVHISKSDEEVSESMAMDSISLGDFLSRPVLISTQSWAESEGAGFKSYITPWQLFFNTATVKYKTNNWAFIRCNLHVRVVFNASPFYYGSLMASYRPLPNFTYSNLAVSGSNMELINYSQMPGRLMIEPQQPEDVEIELPFLWPGNFLRMQKKEDFSDMGYLNFNILAPLRSANGTTGTGITLRVYAWATDVILSGPSVGLSMQDGVIDEYEMDGPISKPASAIANVAARLGDIPIIGRFATATQIGANAVGHIAKLFGFTNVPVIADQHGFQPRALPPMASTDIGYPFEKLTVDSKNELTIDHTSVGLDQNDDLPICSLVQRESYLTSLDWTTSQAADTLLFTSAVTPQLYNATAGSNYNLFMTPMCWAASMFKYWRGDIIFRFRVIASKYHRGRLKLVYDPDGYAGTNVTTDQSSHLLMTHIIDINEETNFEIRIPYQQYLAWCTLNYQNSLNSSNKYWGTSGFKHVRGYTNGSLALTIQNILSAPTDTSTVSVQVFVRGAENLDFAAPNLQGVAGVTSSVIQDGFVDENVKNQGAKQIVSVSSGKISSPIDHLYLTYMGERIASLRVLMRRQCRVFTSMPAINATENIVRKISLPRLPLGPGYDTYGLDTVKGLVTTGSDFPFNFFQQSFIGYIAPAFLGNRGSVNWSAVFDGGNYTPPKHFLVARDPSVSHPTRSDQNTASGTATANDRHFYVNATGTGTGAAIGTGATSNALNWQMPFYSPYKFAPNDYTHIADETVSEFATSDHWTLETSLGTSYTASSNCQKTHLFAGAGTDFDLLYFIHVPTYGVLSATPSP